jgi:hypothetical protein
MAISSAGSPAPDFLIIGSPKAGSTALHAALARHPQLFGSPVKEPKFFMTGGQRPERASQRGPGDAHSAREWIWRESDYRRLFVGAPPGALCFESTPFYLWDRGSHARIAAALAPDAKLIAVVRDPVDRAISNWTHLRADGLEPEPDFLAACRAEPRRIADGWAPFWRYLELGRYGEQLEHLYGHIAPKRVRVIRYRQLVDDPARTLNGLCEFLGMATGEVGALSDSNVGRWSADGRVNEVLRTVVRGGATVGGHLPPQIWRAVERPLLGVLQRGHRPRPKLATEVRAQLISEFAADNALLSRLLDFDFSDWLAAEGRGMYTVRKS